MGRKRTRKRPAAAKAAAAAVEPVEDIEAIEIDLDFSEDAGPASARRAPRVPVDERVEISGFFGVGTPEDRIKDASVNGVFVETAVLLEVGDPVVLHLPLEGGRKLKVSGRVRWVTPFGGLKDARSGMGIELVGLGGEARTALSAMLQRRAR